MSMPFETIYKDNYEKLYTMVFRMTGDTNVTEDVLQNSFLNAYKAYDNFRHESSVYTWLYRIVINCAKHYFRKASKLPIEIFSEEQGIPEEQLYAHINSYGQVEDQAIVNLTRETCLQFFMNCMPSKYRVVYTLRAILHFSVKETARILEISENSVKVNLHRAKKLARSHMIGRCSLIKPGSLCDCRSYARYLIESKKTGRLMNMETIKNREQAASREFNDEMKEILQIDELYNTRVKPADFKNFLERVKKLAKEKHIKLLNY